MPPLYRLLSLRYLWHRWDRAALVVASIALGVATLVSSRTLNRCLETAAARTTTPLGVGDLFVTNGEFGVLRAVADDLRKANLPGVKAVQPLVFERVTLPDLGDRAAVLVGADLTGGPQLADDLLKIDVTLLDPLDALSVALGRKVVVSRAVFDSFRRAHPAGELPPLVLRYGSQRVPYRIAGHFAYHDQSPAKALGQNVIGLELSAAVRLVNPTGPPRVNRVDVYFDKTRPAADILPAVEAVVGDRARVTTPETQGAGTKELVDGIQIGFTLCSAGAMVVGLFLVYNALAVTVAERRHDIGVMRSIGATRGQVLLLFGAAAVVLGLLGAAAGVPLGVGMAKLALHEFRDILASIFLNPDADPGWPTPSAARRAAAASCGGSCTG